jgi:NAD(P)H-hydrate epimerase
MNFMSKSPSSLTRAQVSELDRRAIEEFCVPGIVLMENAGRSAAEVLLDLGTSGPAHIVCGKGNNGGDGFVIARHLDLHDIPVVIHLCADPHDLTGDAGTNYQIAVRSRLPIRKFAAIETLASHLATADWIVDALFGTGLTGPVKAPYDEIIQCMNRSGVRILAVDLPSGMDADSGESLGSTVRASHTVTMAAVKKGFSAPGASNWTGKVHVVGIGAPRCLLEEYV